MSEDDEDPFANLDAPEDREGDPFERLGDVGPDEPADDETESGEVSSEPGPDSTSGGDQPEFEEEFIEEGDTFSAAAGMSTATDSEGDPGGRTDDPLGGDDPFSGMDGREGDPFGEGESAFEAVDVEIVDAEEVWASLDGAPAETAVSDSRYTEVSKHRFCEQCEHFSSPPNAHCTHAEAEIIEYLDMDTVRLLNCPVVAEQRELEDEE